MYWLLSERLVALLLWCFFFAFFSSLKPVYHPAYFLRNSLILMKHAYFIKINEVLIIPI